MALVIFVAVLVAVVMLGKAEDRIRVLEAELALVTEEVSASNVSGEATLSRFDRLETRVGGLERNAGEVSALGRLVLALDKRVEALEQPTFTFEDRTVDAFNIVKPYFCRAGEVVYRDRQGISC